jgi:hypothetical protein
MQNIREDNQLSYKRKSNYSNGIIAFFMLVCFLSIGAPAFTQTLQVGTVTEEMSRLMQLMGKTDSAISYTLRPMTGMNGPATKKLNQLIDSTDTLSLLKPMTFAGKLGQIRLLPVSITQQFNSHHPYGWNDGAMIASKGYQSLIAAGVYVGIGPLEIQLQPEFVFAANTVYESNISYGSNDLKGAYHKMFPGQSSIRISAGAISLGLSSENMWWGPGMHSSLLMSNNAPGFIHAFIGTRKPMHTAIGSFEWQILGGQLKDEQQLVYENFNLKPENWINEWRYLNALVITYQPKWVPGLFVGFSRGLQRYHSDIELPPNDFLNKYFPIIALPIQKFNVSNDEARRTDQLASFFLRWLLNKAHAEVYIEYGFNDYGVNIRDYLMSPTHSAAYITGVKKIWSLPKKNNRLAFGFELTQMTQSPDYIVRNAGNWYEHYQIRQGYTNNNQILGAGAGFGANVQTLTFDWLNGWKKWGIIFERVERDPLNHTYNWIDMSFGLMPQYKYKNMVLAGKCQFINSNNYGWDKDVNRFNLHATLLVQYLL